MALLLSNIAWKSSNFEGTTSDWSGLAFKKLSLLQLKLREIKIPNNPMKILHRFISISLTNYNVR